MRVTRIRIVDPIFRKAIASADLDVEDLMRACTTASRTTIMLMLFIMVIKIEKKNTKKVYFNVRVRKIIKLQVLGKNMFSLTENMIFFFLK